jgi:hypothetical protein
MRRILLVALATITLTSVTRGQEPVASSGFQAGSPPGWTFTPSMGVGETYDDNVSLFDIHVATNENNDFVTTYSPAADLTYAGAHTQFGMGYTASFLDYQTFSGFNRWAQRGHVDLKRQESARLSWAALANAESVPTTDAINFGGLPYRRTGARAVNGRTSVDYRFGARDTLTGYGAFQVVDFDRTVENGGFLEGGHAIEGGAAFRHQIDARLGLGAEYGLRRALIAGDTNAFFLHSVQGAIDYALSPSWSFSGLAGVVFLQPSAVAEGQTGPAVQVAFAHTRNSLTLRTWYLRSYTPSFAFGGTVRTHEAGFGLRSPLFHSRHFYTEHSALFRDDQPLLTSDPNSLPLRSLRTNSIFGWAPQRYVRIEAFYSRVQQSTLRAGGEVNRNRIGIQIVTSKPMRFQ